MEALLRLQNSTTLIEWCKEKGVDYTSNIREEIYEYYQEHIDQKVPDELHESVLDSTDILSCIFSVCWRSTLFDAVLVNKKWSQEQH